MPEAVCEDGGAEPDLVRGDRECAESGDRSHLVTQVVGDHEAVEPEFLGLLRELDEPTRAALVRVALSACCESELTQRAGVGTHE